MKNVFAGGYEYPNQMIQQSVPLQVPQQTLDHGWWQATTDSVFILYNSMPSYVFWFIFSCVICGLTIGVLLMIKSGGNPFEAARCFIGIIKDVFGKMSVKKEK